jgi:hypothetical protein
MLNYNSVPKKCNFCSIGHDGPGMWHGWGNKLCIQSFIRKLLEKCSLKDLEGDGMILLRWMLQKEVMRM